MNFGTTHKDGSAKAYTSKAHKNWACKKASKVLSEKDKRVTRFVSRFTPDFIALAESFSLTCYQFEIELKMQAKIQRDSIALQHSLLALKSKYTY